MMHDSDSLNPELCSVTIHPFDVESCYFSTPLQTVLCHWPIQVWDGDQSDPGEDLHSSVETLVKLYIDDDEAATPYWPRCWHKRSRKILHGIKSK